MKKMFILVFILACLGCQSNKVHTIDQSLPLIKIGFSGPLSGDFSEYGNSLLESIKDSVKKYENKFNIEIIALDDKMDIDLAKQNSNILIDENVDFVIGPLSSKHAETLAPIYSQNSIISVTSSAANPEINHNSNIEFFIRTIPNDYDQSKKMVEYIKRRQYKNICIIYENHKYAAGLRDYINLTTLNSTNLVYEKDNNKLYHEKNKTSNIEPILKSSDLIIYCGYFPGFVSIYKYIRNKLLIDTPFLCSDGVSSETIFKFNIDYVNVSLISSTEYIYFDELKSIYTIYLNKNGEIPGPFYCITYASVDLMLSLYLNNEDLFSYEKDIRNRKIIKILKSEKTQSYFGYIGFNSKGNIDKNGHKIVNIINSEFVKDDL